MKMGSLKDKLGQIIVPMVTPFDKDSGEVNLKEAENLADFLVEKKYCDSIAVTGTTGEFNTMSVEERVAMYKVVHDTVSDRVPLVAGAGAASVKDAIKLCQEAEKIGYKVVMVVAPYYCKPNSEGIYKFFAAVAKSVSIDVMLYNIPLFTGVNVEPAMVTRLGNEFANIKGIKDEAGINPTQMTEYALATPEDFTIYNGDDLMVLCGLVQGAAGVISGGSHLLGDKIREMANLFMAGKNESALKIHRELDPFFRALAPNGRINPNPVLKAALDMAGHPVGPPRLPLSEATPEEREGIKKHLVRLGVI
jgi:4-hydroxy-tetrahydrodipicolinate synthase